MEDIIVIVKQEISHNSWCSSLTMMEEEIRVPGLKEKDERPYVKQKVDGKHTCAHTQMLIHVHRKQWLICLVIP